MKFKDDDVEKMTKFINMINEKMEFKSGLRINDIPNIYSYLAWVQKTLIPTMEANVMEVVGVETKEDREKRAENRKGGESQE